MKVSELGEFGLIELLSKTVGASPDSQLLIGIGDDAAAWYGDASIQLATVDSFIQDVHFSLNTASWNELGWKALAANLSDIAAMGGVPRYALVSLALPHHTEVDDVTALYKGMTITIFGSTRNKGKHILTRSAAKPGEQVAVTGYLGAAAAGSEMLAKQLNFNPEATTCLRDAFLHPHPRLVEGELLVDQGVKSAIDISDGLISDLKQICKASQVSARVEIERVPVEPTVRANFGDRALELALSGGEDYELLFTASTEVIDKVRTAASCPITVIGEIITDKIGEVILVDRKGNPFNLAKAGWEHFTTR